MGERIRNLDWSQTPLGPIESWSLSLRMMVGFLLANRFPLLLWWGPDYISIYNDAYRPVLGGKDAWALGRPVRECWSEIWDVLKPLIDAPFNGGPPTWMEDFELEINRHGFVEETHFTVAYSPVPDETAPRGIGGVLATVHEITEKIIGERRIAALRDLGTRTGEAKSVDEACALALAGLAGHAKDVPFALVYLIEDDGARARLVATTRIESDAPAAPPVIDLASSPANTWPLGEALRREAIVTVEDPPRTAVVVPIKSNMAHQLAGFLVAGVSPRLRLDDQYLGFLELAAGQIASAVASARAYEEERRRAEALAEIDRAKTLFFSNVSHEFRTPLTLMLGPLEDALAGSRLAAPDRERLTVAQRNALRLLKLVNSLLDFSRIEAGRTQASYVPTDLAALTTQLASNFRSACERAGLALDVDCAPLCELAFVDRDMWEKIVLNLLSNAFKFTFAGEIAVGLQAAGGHAELRVRDTGVGIPAHELPRLFERFHRIEGQCSRTYEGSGIGLALVQELVRLHGGTIRAESAPGRGTCFTVRIPLGAAHLPQDRIEARPSLAATSIRAAAYVEEALRWLPGDAAPVADVPVIDVRAASERARVLLADDNADMRAYVQRLLGAQYEVTAAGDGADALAAIRAHRPDLVLADVMMPRLDGFGLVRAIRSDPVLRELPVIMLSARAGEESRVEGLEAGADDYLVKPFSARELIARVEANIALARLRAESARMLEQKVAERTAELVCANDRLRTEAAERLRVEEALRQAQKMESIGRLTGGVAHDFNNLLTVISGNLETIRRRLGEPDRDPAGLARAADHALRGAQRAAALTQRLLAFARQQPLDPRPLDINRLVAGMSDLLRRTIGEQIAIESVLAGGLWRAHVDPNELESAILNLAVNARDAMPDGGRLTIETANTHLDEAYAAMQAEVVPGQYVAVAITDNGSGMTRETIARAFEPFFTTKGIGQGTGLGLSQVYGFVKQSGGHVKIYSEVGEGTTVTIYLPRHYGAAESAQPEPVIKAPRAARAETILAVEDDADVRRYTTDLLRELGYRVIEAADAEAALARLAQHPEIDLLFTDVGLPGRMNGQQLADAARRGRSGLKVLFTTGYERNAIVHDGRLAPGVQLLTKPFTYAGLAAKIRDLLDARTASGRILVVEDEALLQIFAADVLEELGFKPETAGSGTEALARLRLIPGGVDAAIVDLGLPDRRGTELVAELRALVPALPVVIASGQREQTLREQMTGERHIAFLAKPYTAQDVLEALREVGVTAGRDGE